MATIIQLTDLSAPEVDVYARLTEAQLRNKRHPEQGLFIAESAKVIGHALDEGVDPVSFLMEERQLAGAESLLSRCPNVPVYTASRSVLEGLTGYALTRGILCAMRRPKPKTVEEVCTGASRIAVLEGIVDPTNVGAILRSAAALNMDGVLLTPTCCDPLHRRAVRVSMGTVFQIPWARIGDSPADWPEKGLGQLRSLGFHTAAMALCEDSLDVSDPKLLSAQRLAVVLGTEGDGLAKSTIAQCDDTVCIPMAHGVDSLNVAAASAVAFYQLSQRSTVVENHQGREDPLHQAK
jgi:tRNA G18 (ribose-2'-O)-methylase SpoU